MQTENEKTETDIKKNRKTQQHVRAFSAGAGAQQSSSLGDPGTPVALRRRAVSSVDILVPRSVLIFFFFFKNLNTLSPQIVFNKNN